MRYWRCLTSISYLSTVPTCYVAISLKIQQIVFKFSVFLPDEKFTVRKKNKNKGISFLFWTNLHKQAEEQDSATDVGSGWSSSHLNCGVTLTLWMFSMISMSLPVQMSLLQPRQLNFTSDGSSFLMSSCFFIFILNLYSIIACIWNSWIWTNRSKLISSLGFTTKGVRLKHLFIIVGLF